MCGFLAILQTSAKVDVSAARCALGTLTHRGPDAGSMWSDENVFLGHRRLSIIDLETGDQPMQSSDGRYVVVFNGEIYNFPELREHLASSGARFKTRSDTEVILEGYRFWGSNVVDHLHGMFAFVIWDRNRRIAFGARDRLGIKPLCWAMHNGSLIIASTLEPFERLKNFERQYNLVSVRDLMSFDYIPVPRTIYKNVWKLEPGSWFEWSLGDTAPKIERYWTPPLADPSASVPDEFELEELLERAVKRQMISDVPIGAFLSGGIDSSLLVAMMARHGSRPVRTFSVAFAEGDVDESSIAELVARRFGTEHTVLRAEELGADKLLELIGRLDEPFCDPAFVPTYALSEMTKRHVKVALSGDGGDEVFGGYDKYLFGENGHRPLPFSSLFHRLLTGMPWRPRGVGRIYERTLTSSDLVRFYWTRYGNFPVFRKDLRQLLRASYHEAAEIHQHFEPWERRARRFGTKLDTDVLMRADLETYLSENCLVKTDRASMLASLEVRVPYLDEMILDRILPLPAGRKILNGQLKSLLLPIARRLLPREVWDRPKHGFTVPVGFRLAGAWRPAVEAALDWGERKVELFDYRYLRRLHRINLSEREFDREIWNPFVFLAWSMARSAKRKDSVETTRAC
jgi:asparagine synthase (glutamine-hydrolysing)